MRLIRRMRPLRAFALLPLLLLALAACDSESDSVDGDQADPWEELGIAWASIPSGSFTMGCEPEEIVCIQPSIDDCEPVERFYCNSTMAPPHNVDIPAFFMMTTEVTQTQFAAVMGGPPEAVIENPDLQSDCDNCPVVSVLWREARDFCATIDARLPSESEWEYVAQHCPEEAVPGCRGYQFEINDYEWTFLTSEDNLQPVGQLLPNQLGVYDILSNAKELVQDCWHDSYEGAPSDGSAWGSAGNCKKEVSRGYAFYNYYKNISAYNREKGAFYRSSSYQSFRCARDGE